MTNYIHRLQAEVAREKRTVAALEQGLRDLRSYLMSPKFHQDTTVQVDDVLRRMAELESYATDVRDELVPAPWTQEDEDRYQAREAKIRGL